MFPALARRRHAAYFVLALSAAIAAAEDMAASDPIAPNNKAIADVTAGRTDTARASWWGFDPADATTPLQAALDSPAKKVIVDDVGSPWIVTPITLPGQKEIVFESSVVVEAKRGEFRSKHDCLFSAVGRKNLAIRGNGAVLRMHKDDYHRPPYELAEWRHALTIRGCENVTVENLTLRDSGGDGIYLGTGRDRATNRNVTIRRVVCDGNNRQGISVITAEDLLIEDCTFRNTRGTAPQAGIDFEPNSPDERLVNCILRNCRSEDNVGHAYHIYLGHMHRESPPVSIRFENCTSKSCERFSAYVGVANRDGKRTVRGSIEYVGCRFDADRGAGVYIRGNEADGCRVQLKNCEIIRRDQEPGTLAPITIEAPRRLDLDAGNIVLDRCTIRDSLDRTPLAVVASPLTRLRGFGGSLLVKGPSGEQTFTLNAPQIAAWFPEQGLVDRIPRATFDWRSVTPVEAKQAGSDDRSTPRLRRQATLLAWGEAGTPLELLTMIEPVGRHTPSAGTMTVTSTDGTTTRLKAAVSEGHAGYRYAPTANGPLRLQWQGDARATIRVVRSSTPIAMLADSLGLDLFRPTATLHFQVPARTRRFAIQVAGAGTAETVQATVCDATGKVVDQHDNIALPHVFVLQREHTRQPEIWSITLARASTGVLEDVSLQTLGIPAVFAGSPTGLLAPPAETP